MAAAGQFSVDDRVDVAVIAGGGAAVFFNDGADFRSERWRDRRCRSAASRPSPDGR
jgi:hypothetical protein